MKYIIFSDESAVIFADEASHKFIAGDKPVRSAGFCRVETYRNEYDDICAKISCWGKSDSLGVGSILLDEQILERIFR